MTPALRLAAIERYVAGERPAAIAAALAIPLAEVEALLTGGAPASAPAAAPVKRPRKAPAEAAPASVAAPEPSDFRDRNGASHAASHGYGYATVRGGGRRVY